MFSSKRLFYLYFCTLKCTINRVQGGDYVYEDRIRYSDDVIYKEMTSIINNAIDSIISVKTSENPWIKGKKQTCKWLEVSPQTLNKMIQRGLPVHYLNDMDIMFFNKEEINSYILNN